MTNYKDDCCMGGFMPPMPHPRPRPRINQTVLKCGTGSGLVIPDHYEWNSQLLNPYTLAAVSIDTSDFKMANVKVDFSCIIMFKESDGSDLRLTFQLSKTYQSGGKIALGTWTFERDIETNTETTDSFGFTWCECDACPGCAYYTVELINVESNNVDCRGISNPSINALAVGPLASDYEY
ncbi:MAG: DUF4489 domain-containing protein [Syntrophomonadaceae bacterium]|nr:DUF4489 domain-containing protein [Syntrophomonadaceae bacterium]